ncbi:MAG: hypothetical protein EOP42_07995 [Sphingobacteriaceae bacterium]|nr:MAG: hypothetical protein EOP42_07995 [Sphingobacteriaceae bacterium]
MNRTIYVLITVLAFCFATSRTFSQSSYKTAVGLGIDVGDGSTIVGPSIKHFFNEHSAFEAEVLFGNHYATVGAYYQYNRSFKEAKELKWYLGIGPDILINNRGAAFALRPMAGLDYKIKTLPLSLTFDWRPYFFIDEGVYIATARFGLGVRYAFK